MEEKKMVEKRKAEIKMMKKSEMAKNKCQVKERVLKYGVQSLLNEEIVYFLTGIPPKSLNNYDNLAELRDKFEMLDSTDLQKQKIEALFILSNRIASERREKVAIKCPQDVADILMEDMRYLKKEEFRVMMLDTKSNIIKIKTISVGNLNSSIVHPREVIKDSILYSSKSIIVIHNHPSGSTDPSKEDIEITRRLKEACNIVGISLLDSIIIGDGKYLSLKEQELL